MGDQYEKYSADDFVVDESFQDWVRSGKDSAKWQAFIASTPTNLSELEAARSIVANLKFKKKTFDTEERNMVWNNINAATTREVESTNSMVRQISPWKNLRPILGLAATLACLFFAWQFFSDSAIAIQTERAEQKTIELPDGSMVYMNAESKLTYSEQSFLNDRSLFLTGEAFFDVESGSSFTVRTANGFVKVLGTEFNVKSRAERFKVDCFEGSVSIKHSDYLKPILLVQSESWAVNGNGNNEKFANDPASRLAWKSGRFVFREANMAAVFSEIERQFNVDVSYRSQGDGDLFTGQFLAGDLQKALQQVCWPKKLTYKIEGGSVIIAHD